LLAVLGFVILLVVFTGCFNEKDSPELQYSVQNNPYKFGEAEVTKGFYRGGSIIYSKEYPDLNMIAPGQAFTYKMGKFVEKGEGMTELQEKEFGVIQIESVTEDEIKFKYALWEKRITAWKTAELEVGEEVDLNGDGKNDIKWTQGDEERGLEKSRYLTFISSKEKAQITMYQLREEWMPKGFYPYGILQVTPSGSLLMGDRFVKQHQKRAIDKILDGQIDIKSMPFIKDGDTLISDDQGSRRVTRKETLFGGKRSTTDGALEVLTLEEAMKDTDAAAEIQKIGAMEVFDYTAEIQAGTMIENNRRVDIGVPLKLDFKKLLDIQDPGLKEAYIKGKIGVKYDVDVKFHEYFIGCKGNIKIKQTPYLNAEFKIKGELKGWEYNDGQVIPLYPGYTIPLPQIAGQIILGETKITPNIYINGKFDTLVKYNWSKTTTRTFDFNIGYKVSKGKWNDECSSTKEKGAEIEEFQVKSDIKGEVSVSPIITCENTLNFIGVCNVYVNYNLQSKNKITGQYDNIAKVGGCEVEGTLKGWGDWGSWVGFKKTYTIKIWRWKKKFTLDLSKRFSFGNFCNWELGTPYLYGKFGWEKKEITEYIDVPKNDYSKYKKESENRYVREITYGCQGASKIKIAFLKPDLDLNGDFIEIYDKKGNLIETITGKSESDIYFSKEISSNFIVVKYIYDNKNKEKGVNVSALYGYAENDLTVTLPKPKDIKYTPYIPTEDDKNIINNLLSSTSEFDTYGLWYDKAGFWNNVNKFREEEYKDLMLGEQNKNNNLNVYIQYDDKKGKEKSINLNKQYKFWIKEGNLFK
jgi:hypothetical protein